MEMDPNLFEVSYTLIREEGQTHNGVEQMAMIAKKTPTYHKDEDNTNILHSH